jgi:hypothetical protein
MKTMYLCAVISIFLQSSVLLQAQETHPHFAIFKDGIALPDGITIDAQGRVLAHSETLSRTEALQFDTHGTFLDQVVFGDGVFEKTHFIGSRFSYDPFLNLVIMLTPAGDLFQIHPDGLQIAQPVISILPEAVSANHVYDINTGQIVSLELTLDTVLRYGDLALFRPGILPEQLTLLVTGTVERLPEPPVPFVMDMTLDPLSGIIAAQLVLTSSAASFAVESRTRGVAANAHGIGLTTLPISNPVNPGETREVAVAFSVYTAPETAALLPWPVILFNGLDVTSDGMASDQAGHFYAASGDRGSSACEPHRSGALMVVPVDANGLPLGTAPSANAMPAAPAPLGILDPLACFPIATTMDDIVSSRDVAVSPVDQSIVLTVNNQDLVLVISQP